MGCKHGDTAGGVWHELYRKWKDMRNRCRRGKSYVTNGVTVCEDWQNSYLAFKEFALANGWRPGLTTERIDVTGNYEPDNVTFIPRSQQPLNQRHTRRISAFGETKCQNEWARDPRCVVPLSTARRRRDIAGWSWEDALSVPAGEMRPSNARLLKAWGEVKTIMEWSRDSRCSVDRKSIYARLDRGWSPEEAVGRPRTDRQPDA